MKCSFRNVRALLLGFTGAFFLLAAGCATTDETDNLSERPWNAPKSWEGGLPQSMFEGR